MREVAVPHSQLRPGLTRRRQRPLSVQSSGTVDRAAGARAFWHFISERGATLLGPCCCFLQEIVVDTRFGCFVCGADSNIPHWLDVGALLFGLVGGQAGGRHLSTHTRVFLLLLPAGLHDEAGSF